MNYGNICIRGSQSFHLLSDFDLERIDKRRRSMLPIQLFLVCGFVKICLSSFVKKIFIFLSSEEFVAGDNSPERFPFCGETVSPLNIWRVLTRGECSRWRH